MRAKKLIDKIPQQNTHGSAPLFLIIKPFHVTSPSMRLSDWLTLFACRHVKQKPDSYVSTYFKFFPAINRNFFSFHFSLLVYLKISRQFCLLLYMLNENEIITFFCVWLMGGSNVFFILFHTQTLSLEALNPHTKPQSTIFVNLFICEWLNASFIFSWWILKDK